MVWDKSPVGMICGCGCGVSSYHESVTVPTHHSDVDGRQTASIAVVEYCASTDEHQHDRART